MYFFRSRPQRRQSILVKRDHVAAGASLLRSLVIANLIVVGITLAWMWLVNGVTAPAMLAMAVIVALVFTNPITILAHYGSEIVNRRAATRPKIVRMLWLVLAWMLAGGVGSLLAYAVLTAVGFNLRISRNTWSIALLSNGLIAIVIGTFVLLFEATGARMRRRAHLLGQEDLLTAEFEAARNLQKSLLPGEDIRIHGFDISSATAPAVEIGGDYYDYLSFADGSKGILVADAAGKGIPAALVMSKFQGMAQALSIHVASPLDFFVGLNDTLRVRLDRRNFITVGMLTIDFDDCLAFYRAGHNPLLMYSSATERTMFCTPPGIALGLAHGAAVSGALDPHHFVMSPGDVVVLYSDGLTEARNPEGEDYGEERLASIVRTVARTSTALQIREAILGDIESFVNGASPHDDMTLVVVRKVSTQV
jgi:serine phosphatase RsbU (regulator of sigma subunit)